MYSSTSQQTLHHAQTGSNVAHLGDLGTQVLVLFWVLEKVYKLHNLQLSLLTPRHITAPQRTGSPTHQPCSSPEETQIFSPKLCLDVGLLVDHLGCGLADSKDTLSAEKVASDDTKGGKEEEISLYRPVWLGVVILGPFLYQH